MAAKRPSLEELIRDEKAKSRRNHVDKQLASLGVSGLSKTTLREWSKKDPLDKAELEETLKQNGKKD